MDSIFTRIDLENLQSKVFFHLFVVGFGYDNRWYLRLTVKVRREIQINGRGRKPNRTSYGFLCHTHMIYLMQSASGRSLLGSKIAESSINKATDLVSKTLSRFSRANHSAMALPWGRGRRDFNQVLVRPRTVPQVHI